MNSLYTGTSFNVSPYQGSFENKYVKKAMYSPKECYLNGRISSTVTSHGDTPLGKVCRKHSGTYLALMLATNLTWPVLNSMPVLALANLKSFFI